MTSSGTKGAPNIVQLMLPEQGRSQAQRLLLALQKDYVAIEERNVNELFDVLKKLSQNLKFYTHAPSTSDADWSAFFPFELGQANEWLTQHHGKVEPHLALVKVFLDQFIAGPVAQQNNLQQSYIDFYYEHVLNFSKRTAIAEHAHLVLSLKKGAAPLLINEQDNLIAGKREDGSVIFAAPVRSTIINQAQVVDMRSTFTPLLSPTAIQLAPIANSADGLGEKFETNEAHWSAFGHNDLQFAEIGFALSSPILRMNEGVRKVTLNITLTETIDTVNRDLNSIFKVFLSAEKGWTDSQFASASVDGKKLILTLELDENEPAIVPYNAELHAFSFDTQEPILQCLVDKDAQNELLSDIYQAHIESIAISVDVSNVQSLNIVSDLGAVNADASFLPFGPTPKKGSVFTLSSDEVFSKRLKQVRAMLTWKNVQKNVANLYNGYKTYEPSMPSSFSNSYFTANVTLTDGEGRQTMYTGIELFNSTDANLVQTVTISEQSTSNNAFVGKSHYANTLGGFKSNWAKTKFDALTMVSPQYGAGSQLFKTNPLTAKTVLSKSDKALKFTLNKSFFHDKYRKAYVKNVIAVASDPNTSIISEPYTPELASITLDYSAYTRESSFTNSSVEAFAQDELRLFHVDCFGQRREHAYQRQQLNFVDDKRVGLFSVKQETGAFYIGLSGLVANDSCQLLLQVIEGSADPSLPAAEITWAVLCDNYFQNLDDKSLLLDTTDNLQTSGLVALLLPKETTTEHTIMPSKLVWLKLSITGNAKSVCKLRAVHSNGIEVVGELAEQTTIADSLIAGSITKFEKSKPSIKSISQDYEGFGGASEETSDDFSARVSARLRHKDRALSVWDFESLVLEHFPNIHRVKTVPHSKPNNWQAPGNVTILMVPYIDAVTAAEPLTPKVSIHTINQVKAFLASRCAMQAQLHVINPCYVKIRMTLKVAFVKGFDVNYYTTALNTSLQTFFAPWTHTDDNDTSSDISLTSPQFGGRVYKSVVLDFIEEHPYVDYITNLVMQASLDGVNWENDAKEIRPLAPDQILTSALNHVVMQVSE